MRTAFRQGSSAPQARLWQWADCASGGTQRNAPQLRSASSRPSTPPRASAAYHGAHAGGARTGSSSLTPMPDHPSAQLRAQTWRAACALRCTRRRASAAHGVQAGLQSLVLLGGLRGRSLQCLLRLGRRGARQLRHGRASHIQEHLRAHVV